MEDVQAVAEAFRGIVCHVSLAFLAILISAPAIAWLVKTLAIPVRRVFGGGIVRAVLAVAMVGTGIVESFSKHTNVPPRIAQLSGGGRGATALLPVTPTDISNGWRVAATREGRAPSRPQDGTCTIHEPWLLRGGFKDIVRIPFGGWLFPWCGGFADGLTVFSDGKIRPALRTPYFPRPLDVPLAVLPAFNWHQLPGGVSNVFWHTSTPSNSLVVAWENAPVNYDASSLTNFQAEFFADGRFAYRYDDHVVDYAPVFPFDWDNDGLENTVDPDPLVAGPDAHGTNVEWYNTVCSNVFEATSWRTGVNSNAYYFVDVVAERGPAPIYFTGDRDSRLGNPVVVARGGETNRVPLLIGIDYAVTSTVPMSISIPANSAPPDAGACYTAFTTNGVSSYAVQWPLEFTVAPDGMGYSVSAGPYDPGCEIQWDLPTRSAACSYTVDGGWIGFNCGSAWGCECDGCSVSGVAMLEDVSFDLPYVWCGCWHHASGNSGNGQYTTNGPSVSVSFDKQVVFYEDAYTNAPNDVVAKHSTNTTLTVSAYGGEAGGMLYVSEQSIGKLVRVGGKAIFFPYAAFVPPNGGVTFSIEYEADTHSDSEGDITVTASLMPGDGGEITRETASVTAVKVQLNALIAAPLDGNTSRHEYGVGEIVTCTHWPKDLSVSWNCQAGRMEELKNWFWYLHIPIIDDVPCNPRILAGEESYAPMVSIREPMKYYCANAVNISTNLGANVAGGAGMSLELYIEPRGVCFGNIALEEVPTEYGQVGGYFMNEEFVAMWAHTRARRAGQWYNVGNDNLFMLEDEAIMGDDLPPMAPDGTLTNDVSFGWRDGAIVWTIPLGWNERGTIGETDPIKTNAVPEHQTFTITPNGTLTVIKAGFFVSRGTNTQTRMERIQR